MEFQPAVQPYQAGRDGYRGGLSLSDDHSPDYHSGKNIAAQKLTASVGKL